MNKKSKKICTDNIKLNDNYNNIVTFVLNNVYKDNIQT